MSGPGLVAALHRLDEIRALGVSDISLDHLPLNRLRVLARYAAAARAKPSAAWRLNAERQPSSPLRMRLSGRQWMMPSTCWMGWLATSSGALIKKVKRNDSAPCMTSISPLYNCGMPFKSSWIIRQADRHPDPNLSTGAADAPPEAGAEVEKLTRPPNDNYYEELVERYNSVRRFLPTLLRTVSFEAFKPVNSFSMPWHFSVRIENQRRPDMRQASGRRPQCMAPSRQTTASS